MVGNRKQYEMVAKNIYNICNFSLPPFMSYHACHMHDDASFASSLILWLGFGMAGQVEDPFEQPENTARAINARQLMRISEAFQMTHFRLTSVHQNQNSILNDLARPQISQFIIKPSESASAPTFNMGNYPPIYPQVHQARVTHPRPWIRQQFQDNVPRLNMRNFPPINPQVPHAGTTESRPSIQHKTPNTPNTPNTRRVRNPNNLKVGEPSKPPKTYNGQGQQKWRPRSQRQVSWTSLFDICCCTHNWLRKLSCSSHGHRLIVCYNILFTAFFMLTQLGLEGEITPAIILSQQIMFLCCYCNSLACDNLPFLCLSLPFFPSIEVKVWVWLKGVLNFWRWHLNLWELNKHQFFGAIIYFFSLSFTFSRLPYFSCFHIVLIFCSFNLFGLNVLSSSLKTSQ